MKLLSLFLIIPLLMLTGCGAASCLVKDKVATGMTDWGVERFQCSNPENVHKKNVKIVESFGICKPKTHKTGPFADALCPVLAQELSKAVVGGGLQELYPDGGCHGTLLQSDIADFGERWCKKVPVKYCPRE